MNRLYQHNEWRERRYQLWARGDTAPNGRIFVGSGLYVTSNWVMLEEMGKIWPTEQQFNTLANQRNKRMHAD